jgi:hypothetical protein
MKRNILIKAIIVATPILLVAFSIWPVTSLAQTSTKSTTSPTIVPNPNITNSNLETNSAGIAIISSEQVVTEEDLEVFEDNMKILNPNIGLILTDTDQDGMVTISVDYIHPGKFLGVPVTYRSITTVMSTTTTNSLPYIDSRFSFLSSFVSDKKVDNQKIIDRVASNPIVQTETTPDASPRAQARIAEAIATELDQNEMEQMVTTP